MSQILLPIVDEFRTFDWMKIGRELSYLSFIKIEQHILAEA